MRKLNMNGFTLIEMIVVTIIIGILATIGVISYSNNMEQTKAQQAENNLLAIAAAEQKYYEDWSTYCTNAEGGGAYSVAPYCDDNPTDLNSRLKLYMSTNDPFFANYLCTAPVAPSTLYTCTTNDGLDALTLNVTAAGATVGCAATGNTCP